MKFSSVMCVRVIIVVSCGDVSGRDVGSFDCSLGINWNLHKWRTSLWYSFGLPDVSGSLARKSTLLTPQSPSYCCCSWKALMNFCNVNEHTVVLRNSDIHLPDCKVFFSLPGVVPEREGKMAKDDDQAGRKIGREMCWDRVRQHAEWHGVFPDSRTRCGGPGIPPAANSSSQPSFRIGEFIPCPTGVLLMRVRDRQSDLFCSPQRTAHCSLLTANSCILITSEANSHVLCVRKERSHGASAYYVKIIHYCRKMNVRSVKSTDVPSLLYDWWRIFFPVG